MKEHRVNRFTLHLERDENEAKFWVNPIVQVAYNDGFDARALRELSQIIEGNRERIGRVWNEFFG